MDTLIQDVQYAFRTLRRSPSFTIAAAAAIAVGIGANTAIFGVFDVLLLRGLPFDNADRMVVVWDEQPSSDSRYNEVAPGNYRALKERSKAFAELAAWDFSPYTLTGGTTPERVMGLVVEPNLFSMLGVRPALGRSFRPDEADIGADPVALLSHALWQQRFGGDTAIIGQTITANGNPTTVVGVMPPDFFFGTPSEMWTPLIVSEEMWGNFRRHTLRVVGVLAEGADIRAARAEAAAIALALEQEHPETNTGWRQSIYPLREGLYQGPIGLMVSLLLGAVAFVLLIACADVANLMLVRATGRGREMAVRAALGAGRARLMRQLLTESILLAMFGGLIGVILAAWGLDLVRAATPQSILQAMPDLNRLGIDTRVLVFTFAISLVTGLLFGFMPAIRGSGFSLGLAMREGERGTLATRHTNRMRSALVSAQVALALVLFSAATLLMQAFRDQVNANPGFRSGEVLTFWLSGTRDRYPDGPSLVVLQRQLLERLESLPEIDAVAITNSYPLSGEQFRPAVTIEGRTLPDAADRPAIHTRLVSAGYLELLGVPLQRGRMMTGQDDENAAPIALISRAMADGFFAGQDPIGQRLRLEGDSARTIVGVVGDVIDWRTGTMSHAYVYVPSLQWRPRSFAVMARLRAPVSTALPAIRREVFAIDPAMPVWRPMTMEEVLDESLFDSRFGAASMSVFAIVALVLAGIGVFGVMAYVVGQRSYELGVRMALGARTADIRRLMLLQGFRPVLLGVAIGLPGALAARRAVIGFVFTQETVPLFDLWIAALFLLGISLLAVWIPTRRATRVDPMMALRSE